MITHDCLQGSDAWAQLRAGIPTASEFSRLVTNTLKDGEYKLSTSLPGYAAELAAEVFAGKPLTSFDGNFWADRGREKEAEAVDLYAFTHDAIITRVGFVTTDDGLCGCSPDALIGDLGGLEVKVPKAETMVEIISYHQKHNAAPAKYTQQPQACMWITGRFFWDQMFYHPDLPPLVVRQTPDPLQHAAFAKAVAAVIAERDSQLDSLRRHQTHIPQEHP